MKSFSLAEKRKNKGQLVAEVAFILPEGLIQKMGEVARKEMLRGTKKQKALEQVLDVYDQEMFKLTCQIYTRHFKEVWKMLAADLYPQKETK